MENVILVFVLVAILGGAIVYIVRAKRRGIKCIGCPMGASCAKKGGFCGSCNGEAGQSSCNCHEKEIE